jgi:hypothetical protein
MLIHDPPPPPPPSEGRAVLEPNWILCLWLAVAALLWVGAAHTTGVVGFVLVCGTFAAICRAATEAVGYADGLREWRQ